MCVATVLAQTELTKELEQVNIKTIVQDIELDVEPTYSAEIQNVQDIEPTYSAESQNVQDIEPTYSAESQDVQDIEPTYSAEILKIQNAEPKNPRPKTLLDLENEVIESQNEENLTDIKKDEKDLNEENVTIEELDTDNRKSSINSKQGEKNSYFERLFRRNSKNEDSRERRNSKCKSDSSIGEKRHSKNVDKNRCSTHENEEENNNKSSETGISKRRLSKQERRDARRERRSSKQERKSSKQEQRTLKIQRKNSKSSIENSIPDSLKEEEPSLPSEYTESQQTDCSTNEPNAEHLDNDNSISLSSSPTKSQRKLIVKNHENIEKWLQKHGIQRRLRSFSTATFTAPKKHESIYRSLSQGNKSDMMNSKKSLIARNSIEHTQDSYQFLPGRRASEGAIPLKDTIKRTKLATLLSVQMKTIEDDSSDSNNNNVKKSKKKLSVQMVEKKRRTSFLERRLSRDRRNSKTNSKEISEIQNVSSSTNVQVVQVVRAVKNLIVMISKNFENLKFKQNGFANNKCV